MFVHSCLLMPSLASYSWTLSVITPFTLKFYEKKYFCLIYLRPNNGLERQVWNFAVLANSGQNNNQTAFHSTTSSVWWGMLCTVYSWIHLRWISSLCGCLSILYGCMLISFSSWTVRFHCKVSTVNLMYRSIIIIHCAVKPVLNGRIRGIAYWPFNTSLTSLIVTQENDDQRAKYLSHDKLTWKCLCLFLCEKKGIKDHWMLCTVYLLH